MRNITQRMNVILMVMCCLFGLKAVAQDETPTIKVGEQSVEVISTFNPSVQVEAGVAYSGDVIGFNAAGVAEALGIGNIAEAAQYIVNADGTCVENDTDGWRDKDGNAAGWGSGEGMVCVKIQNPASGVIDYVGAIDDTHVAGDKFLARWAFVANNLAVVINVNVGFVNTNPASVIVDGQPVPVETVQTVLVDVFEKTAYTGDQGTFDAAALATALGVAQLSDAKAYIVNPTSGICEENNTDGWRDGFGDMAGWGTSPSGVCVKIQEPNTGLVDYVGTIDETHVAGENPGYTAIWAFVANGKAALVTTKIKFVVDPASLVVIPEQQTDIAKVNVLKKAEVSSDRYATGGYETSPVELTLTDIASTLGIEKKEDLERVFDQLIYVIGEDDIQCKGNTLQLLTKTDGWLAQAVTNIDGMAGDPLDEVIGAYYGGNSKFFVQQMAYDAENDKVSFVVGQYPGNLQTGEKWPVDLYVLWGDKAYVIRYTMNIAEPPSAGFDGMEQVGETIELVYEQQPTTDYSAVSVMLDTQAAAEALGCEEGSLSLKALISENGFSMSTTANNGGWWFNKEGFVTSYGNNSAFFIEPAASGVYSALNMGQMPNVLADGESVSTSLYLVNGEKFVKYHITFNIVQKEIEGSWEDWTSVATRTLNIQQEANEGYAWSSKAGVISNAELTTLIGTTAPTLYALLDPATLETGACPYTDNYSMGEKPGFWLTNEGYRADWGNNAPWGITSQAATTGVTDGWGFKCIQMPGEGVVGNSFGGTFYLVNEENGKMITVLIVNSIVDEVVEAEIVGNDELNAPVSNSDYVAPFDLAPIAKAIGFESLDEMMEEYVMFGVQANGLNSEPVTPATWLNLDIEGKVVPEGEGQIFVFFENGTINVSCNDFSPAEDWVRSLQIFFEHPTTGLRYVLNLTLMSQAGFDGIDAIKVSGKQIFDLSGRQIPATSTLKKGLYIVNGKVIKL